MADFINDNPNPAPDAAPPVSRTRAGMTEGERIAGQWAGERGFYCTDLAGLARLIDAALAAKGEKERARVERVLRAARDRITSERHMIFDSESVNGEVPDPAVREELAEIDALLAELAALLREGEGKRQ